MEPGPLAAHVPLPPAPTGASGQAGNPWAILELCGARWRPLPQHPRSCLTWVPLYWGVHRQGSSPCPTSAPPDGHPHTCSLSSVVNTAACLTSWCGFNLGPGFALRTPSPLHGGLHQPHKTIERCKRVIPEAPNGVTSEPDSPSHLGAESGSTSVLSTGWGRRGPWVSWDEPWVPRVRCWTRQDSRGSCWGGCPLEQNRSPSFQNVPAVLSSCCRLPLGAGSGDAGAKPSLGWGSPSTPSSVCCSPSVNHSQNDSWEPSLHA